MNVSYNKIVRTALPYLCLYTAIIVALSGCDSVGTNTDIQDIVEVRWQPDGSAIYGFMDKLTLTQYQTIPPASYMITKFNSDGSFNKSIPTDQPAQSDISFSIYISPNASELITQVGSDLYQITPATNAYSKIYEIFHLLVASPDLHYAVGSISQSNHPIKTVVIADISVQPARIVRQFDVAGIALEPGIWLNNGRFAITLQDSVKTHITIFDTTGATITAIAGAETAYHNTVYAPSSNTMYFRNQAQLKTDGSVDKINLTSMQRANVLPQGVESFDVSQDEGMIVFNQYIYNSDSTTQTLTMFAKNLTTGNQSQVTNDVLSLAVLSPAADRVAYIHQRDVNYNELFVKGITRP
ncbi:MAG TPA: hypothetical protein VEW28_04435 [Candidatus Kapabacteria bacterium]|nr:hypothetical protein [Candidatus Kapabacteria bacterium]